MYGIKVLGCVVTGEAKNSEGPSWMNIQKRRDIEDKPVDNDPAIFFGIMRGYFVHSIKG
jgi:hypothetical protein